MAANETCKSSGGEEDREHLASATTRSSGIVALAMLEAAQRQKRAGKPKTLGHQILATWSAGSGFGSR